MPFAVPLPDQVGNGSGTYIFYPNKDKPKMWVGQYKCLNPGDLLCNQACATDAIAACDEATSQCVDQTGCGLMQYCMPVSTEGTPTVFKNKHSLLSAFPFLWPEILTTKNLFLKFSPLLFRPHTLTPGIRL